MATKPQTDPELLDAVASACNGIEARLKEALPPVVKKPGGKLLHACEVFPEVSSYRVHDLATAALSLYRDSRIVPHDDQIGIQIGVI